MSGFLWLGSVSGFLGYAWGVRGGQPPAFEKILGVDVPFDDLSRRLSPRGGPTGPLKPPWAPMGASTSNIQISRIYSHSHPVTHTHTDTMTDTHVLMGHPGHVWHQSGRPDRNRHSTGSLCSEAPAVQQSPRPPPARAALPARSPLPTKETHSLEPPQPPDRARIQGSCL